MSTMNQLRSDLSSPPPHTSPYNPAGNTLTHRSVQASKDPVDIYDNAVLTPEELPMAKRPKYYPFAKGALLILCFLGIIHGLYSLALGAYVQSRGGVLYPGLHDMPYKAVIASFFVGGFTFAVSLTLFTVAYRNWHPSLITFGLFVIFIIFSNIAMDRLLAPGPLLREQQYISFRQVPATTAKILVNNLGCCGYINSTVCKLSEWGIPQGPGVTTGVAQTPVTDPTAAAPATPAAAIVAAKVKRSADQGGASEKKLFRRQQVDPGAVDPNAAAPVEPTTPAGPATPPEPAAPVIPQNGPGVPLPTDAAPTADPNAGSAQVGGAVNTGAVNAPLVDSGYPTCDSKLNPLVDGKLLSIRMGYIVGAVLSCLQLGFLGAFWHILGQWKRARGVGRW